MREVDSVGAIVSNRPREVLQLTQHVRRRARLAIEAYRARLLLLFATSDVKDHHAQLILAVKF